MANGKLTYFIVIFQAVFVENNFEEPKGNSLIAKLSNQTQSETDQTFVRNSAIQSVQIIVPDNYHACRYRYTNGNPATHANFANEISRSYGLVRKMETRDVKSGQSDPMTGWQEAGRRKGNEFAVRDDADNDYHGNKVEDDDDDDDDDDDAYDDDENEAEKKKEEEEEDDEYGFDFLGNDRKSTTSKPKRKKEKHESAEEDVEEEEEEDDEDDTPQLKHIFKRKLKMKDFMFLLLLVYKLKFVALIPLFLGALILLAGTTTMAGFFFALFSAALGLQGKSHH